MSYVADNDFYVNTILASTVLKTGCLYVCILINY